MYAQQNITLWVYLQCSYVHHLVKPEMANASILLDIRCCLLVDQELAVDTNTQPNTKKLHYIHAYMH